MQVTDTGADHAARAWLQGAGAEQMVDLSWNGATSNNIDIYRNGALIATVPNIRQRFRNDLHAREKRHGKKHSFRWLRSEVLATLRRTVTQRGVLSRLRNAQVAAIPVRRCKFW